MLSHSYNQPEKRAVREAVWLNAIGTLTANRPSAPLVQEDELLDVLAYAMRILELPGPLVSEVEREHEAWLGLFRTRVGLKKPDQLRVLYLCGPEPLNDLIEMISHGVSPQNVWAVEASGTDFGAAVAQLERSGTPLKIHRGDLSGFLELYDDKFDIVYYDACGPLAAGKPSTLNPLLSLLIHSRLEPLSVVMTNFATVPSEQTDRYARLLTAYWRFRYRDLPKAFWESDLDPACCEHEPGPLHAYIKRNMEPFYSDFVTRFIVDLARSWIPNCRALANRDVAKSYLVEHHVLSEMVDASQCEPTAAASLHEWLDQAGDVIVNASGYPLLSFYRAMKQITPTEPLVSQLGNMKFGGQEAHRLLPLAALLDKVIEGHWGILHEDLLRAVQLSWFDYDHHFSCDVPLPNLLINTFLGVYGGPYFPNPRAVKRYSYRAKQTTMFTDLITLDRCRYFFDWFPVVHMAPDRFQSIPFQILARCILDRIGRADFSSDSHPFRGSSVAGHGEISSAGFYDFAPREQI